jgi:hypothetical protein
MCPMEAELSMRTEIRTDGGTWLINSRNFENAPTMIAQRSSAWPCMAKLGFPYARPEDYRNTVYLRQHK